jgi:hypothetical protein
VGCIVLNCRLLAVDVFFYASIDDGFFLVKHVRREGTMETTINQGEPILSNAFPGVAVYHRTNQSILIRRQGAY